MDLFGTEGAVEKRDFVEGAGEPLSDAHLVAVASQDHGRRVGGKRSRNGARRDFDAVHIEDGPGAVVGSRQVGPLSVRDVLGGGNADADDGGLHTNEQGGRAVLVQRQVVEL